MTTAAEARKKYTEDFTNAIRAFLQQRVEVEKRDAGIVVGIVDEHGSSIVSCGKMDNGTDQEVNGDTVFEIGSITKTFTAVIRRVPGLPDCEGRKFKNLSDENV